jgi:hypothetical protein
MMGLIKIEGGAAVGAMEFHRRAGRSAPGLSGYCHPGAVFFQTRLRRAGHFIGGAAGRVVDFVAVLHTAIVNAGCPRGAVALIHPIGATACGTARRCKQDRPDESEN